MRRSALGAALALTTIASLSAPGLVAATPRPAVPQPTTAQQATTQQERIRSAEKTLEVDYQVQETGYWCGPAAARHALSARMNPPSQADLAEQMGTTENGTDDISQITDALNANLGEDHYSSTYMPDDPPNQQQRDQLWADIVGNIDAGYPVVTNIVAPPGNQPPGYPPDQTIYHYFTVIGYNDADSTVLIADSASFSGNQIYWLSFDQLSTLIPPKGYAA